MDFSARFQELGRKIRTVARQEDEIEQQIKHRDGRSVVRDERQMERQVQELEEEFKTNILDEEGVERLENFVDWELFLVENYTKLMEAVMRADEYMDSNPSVAESEIKKAERISTKIEEKRTEIRSALSEDQEKMMKLLQNRGQLLETIKELETVVQRLETEESVMREEIPDSKFDEITEEIRDIEEIQEKLERISEKQEIFEEQLGDLRGRLNVSNQLQSIKNRVSSGISPEVERVKRIVESLRELPEHRDEPLEEVDKLTHKTRGFVPDERELNDLTMITLEHAEESDGEMRMRAETEKRSDLGVQEQVEIRVYIQNRSEEVQHGTMGVLMPDGWTVTGMLDADIATPGKAAKRYVLEPGQKQVLKILAWQYGGNGDSFQMFTTHFPRNPCMTRKHFKNYPLPQTDESVDYHSRIEVLGDGKSEMPEQKVALNLNGSPNSTEPKTYNLDLELENTTEEFQNVKLVAETPEGWRFNGVKGFSDASPRQAVQDLGLEPGESKNLGLSLWKHAMSSGRLEVKLVRKNENRESVVRKNLP
jgi:hypothetical protein